MAAGNDDGNWPEDLATEIVHAFLTEAIGAAAREEIDLPHIVLCRDLDTGAVSYSGPFRDGVTALVVAERESVLDRAIGEGVPMEFSVAALLPAVVPAAPRDS